MKRLATIIGGLQVTVELHNPVGQDGPGVGVKISGALEGKPVEGCLHDLYAHGELPIRGHQQRVPVSEPLIDQIDEWCTQFMF